MGVAEDLDGTIRQIYGAAADFALWPRVLAAIEEVTGSVGAVINFVPIGDGANLTLAGRFTNEQCATYSREYQDICQRIRFGVAHPEIPVHCDAMVLSEYEMDRDPVYEWFGRHGLRYYMGGHLAPTRTHVAYWSVQRSPQQGHAQAGDMDLFGLLSGHMSQAIALAEKLGTLQSASRFGFALLNSLPQAIFALDSDGTVVFANRPAEELLLSRDGFTADRGALRLRCAAQQGDFDSLVQRALGAGGTVRGGWIGVERASGKRPYAAFVSALETDEPALPDVRARALVVVHAPDQPLLKDPDALRRLYGLTEAEARLALALADGHSIASAAARLGTSGETARVHLKAIFRKTQTNRQQDLIRLMASLK